MWIEERANQRFKFVEQFRDPLTNRKRRVCVTYDRNTSHTRKEAQTVLTKRINQIMLSTGEIVPSSTITLGEITDMWLKYFKPRVKFNTFRNNLCRSKSILSALGRQTLLVKLSPFLLNQYFDDLLYVHHYKNSTVQKFRGTLNSILKYAMRQNYIQRNPLNNVNINYRYCDRAYQPEEKFLYEDELHQVLNYMYQRSPHYGRFCEFLYLTGMRYGEAASLTIADLETRSDKSVIAKVRGTLVDGHKQSSPKTPQSNRDVVLPERAVDICLAELKSHQKQSQLTVLILFVIHHSINQLFN